MVTITLVSLNTPNCVAMLISAVSDDFDSYCKTHDLIDEQYKNQDEWISKCILSVARMGFFTSDRCINEYADSIWNIEPLQVKEEGEVRARTGLEN